MREDVRKYFLKPEDTVKYLQYIKEHGDIKEGKKESKRVINWRALFVLIVTTGIFGFLTWLSFKEGLGWALFLSGYMTVINFLIGITHVFVREEEESKEKTTVVYDDDEKYTYSDRYDEFSFDVSPMSHFFRD